MSVTATLSSRLLTIYILSFSQALQQRAILLTLKSVAHLKDRTRQALRRKNLN